MSEQDEASRAEKVKQQSLEQWGKQPGNFTAIFSNGRERAEVRYLYVSDIPTSIPHRPRLNQRRFTVTLHLTAITETREPPAREAKETAPHFYQD